jgi:tRNA/tmRNA/rRNA uracil-C5-methylase (TrmA/RlmC/RlmD family)
VSICNNSCYHKTKCGLCDFQDKQKQAYEDAKAKTWFIRLIKKLKEVLID